MLIFEHSRKGRGAGAQAPAQTPDQTPPLSGIPDRFLRKTKAALPAVSELQAVRHYTRLSQRNFSIDTLLHPLGSCTMKYTPRAASALAMLPGFLARHPEAPAGHSQGIMACLYELQEILKALTGMQAVSLSPAAGAQGEFTGAAMIRAYHDARKDSDRSEILVPDTAYGANPASAAMCGYQVREVPTRADGDMDLTAMQQLVGPQTAGIMLTNTSTLGLFERRIAKISALIHAAGGLLYYDDADLNAILGKVKPGDMGFDLIHLNLHKTLATPDGGGGGCYGHGAGPVAASAQLAPYLPVPMVTYDGSDYSWLTEQECPQSIGRLSTFAGNAGAMLRAYVYARMLGREGITRVAEFSTLNANYMLKRLQALGFEPAFPQRRATHKFIVSLRRETQDLGVNTMDFANRLRDMGFYAPTAYCPLLIPEGLLIEPTETEDKATLDRFIAALARIREEAQSDPELIKGKPHSLPDKQLDDVSAAGELDLAWRP